MDAGIKLRRTVAEFFNVDEGQVGPSFSLQSSQGSIARAALDAAIRRGAGLKSQAVYSAKTFGELAADLGLGGEGHSASPEAATVASAPTPATASASSSNALASCGVDMELIEHLPVVADPWEDAFYRSNFSGSEIAYCLRQPEPSTHFAARWCAKEALKKCDRDFLAVEGKDVEVAHDEAGAPHLVHLASGSPRRLPHAVSLSHTTQSAVAVVVRVEEPRSPAPAAAPTTAAAPVPVASLVVTPPPPARYPKILVALNLVALLLAAAAFYRTFPGLRWPFSG